MLTRWAKERYGAKGSCCYVVIAAYIFLYFSFTGSAATDRKYWVETANYGVSMVDSLANTIADEVAANLNEVQNVYTDYGEKTAWRNSIPWSKLHLMRILSLDKGYNMLNRNGDDLLRYKMPRAELSSFRYVQGNKSIYLSNRKKDLHTKLFDAVYLGCKKTEEPDPIVFIQELNTCYNLIGERIEYHSEANFPEFSMVKYLPGKCAN